MAVFGPNQVGELIVGNAVAAETTVATFIASASDKEIKVLSKNGGAPAVGVPFNILQKTSGDSAKNLNYEFTDVVKPGQVNSVTLAAYSSAVAKVVTVSGFTVGPRANTTYEVLIRITEDGGSLSTENFRVIQGFYVTGDDVTGITNNIIMDGIIANINKAQEKEGTNNFTLARVGTTITVTEVLKASDPAKDIADPLQFDVQAYIKGNTPNPATGTTTSYSDLSVAVTTAQSAGVGTGKGIANYEWFTKGYKYEVYRDTGYPANFNTPYYAQDQSKTYNVISINHYSENVVAGVERQPKSITVAVEFTVGDVATNADTNAVLADLRTVLGAGNVPADLAVA